MGVLFLFKFHFFLRGFHKATENFPHDFDTWR